LSKQRVSISWSGGKDSAFALYKILRAGQYEVAHLHTVIGKDTRRVGLHGVPEELIEHQARALNLPLKKLYLKNSDDHDAYVDLMNSFYQEAREEGIAGVVFGDIFLEDLRKFRERLLEEKHLLPIFPIWKIESSQLLDDFINTGFKTLICSADASLFDRQDLGKTIDHAFLNSVKDKIDPCGENGEFHTFVYDGPIFRKKIQFDLGDVVKKSYSFKKKNDDGTLDECTSSFWFQDLIPRIASR
jgi:uncharacterized protein (TIGR00290 family)